MSETRARFVALHPDERLTALLWRYKERTRELAGPQTFLDHPPHLTVYLSEFPEGTRLSPSLEELAEGLAAPRVRVLGWHVFAGDPLTGGNTLVCDIHPEDQQALRRVQGRVVAAVSELRDRPATEERFSPRRSTLSDGQWADVTERGFPYLGDGWIPHFTVASIKPEDWDRVYSELGDDPPSGEFTCSELCEYELIDGHNHLVRVIPLIDD